MEPNERVQKVVAEVESLTGCPVQVTQDASIRKMAVLDVARGPVRLHRIRIHPNFRDESAYLTCFECGFILRKFAGELINLLRQRTPFLFHAIRLAIAGKTECG